MMIAKLNGDTSFVLSSIALFTSNFFLQNMNGSTFICTSKYARALQRKVKMTKYS